MTLLDDFEKKLSVKLPVPLKEFLSSPKELEYFTVPTIEEFISLNLLFPGVPARTIPFLRQSDGDLIGLYFPRENFEPLIVYFLLEESRIVPLTSDLERFFSDPDLYSPEHEENDDDLRSDPPDTWTALLYSVDSVPAELELLKPLSINSAYEGPEDKKQFKKLSLRFGSKVRQAQIISGHFRNTTSPLDREWWLDLAEKFVAERFWSEAIQSLENCQITHFIHPHYGQFGSEDQFADDSWELLLAVFERLMPLVQMHGDSFDRVTVAHQLETTIRMASEQAEEYEGLEEDEGSDQAVVIKMDVRLSDIIDLTDDELGRIKGVDDTGKVVHLLPTGNTSSKFFVEIGARVELTFNFDEATVPLGEVLQEIALYLRDDYLPKPARFRTRGVKLDDILVRGFEWPTGECNGWDVITNFQD